MVIQRTWSPADYDALTMRVLAVLPGPGQTPRPTPEIRREFGDLDPYERENYVRKSLDRLVLAGWAERVPVAGDPRAFWRRTQTGQEGHRRGISPPPTH